MVAAARRPASPPGQSPVGPCPFLNAKSEEWRVKSEERKGLLMFHGTLFTLHSSLFTLRILRENGVWLCGQQGFQRPPNRSSYSEKVGVVDLLFVAGARNGGQVGPERSFVNCIDAADLRIAAPKNPKSPRPRHALAVQARKPSVLVGPPPSRLDELTLGGP